MDIVRSSKTDQWATPKDWFRYLDLEFDFTLDACANASNATCDKYFSIEEDGLNQPWTHARVFLNPPYGRQIGDWMQKAFLECLNNYALVVCLVPARVETQWWHKWVTKASEVRFPVGRIQFNDCGVNAPFPVAIVIYRPKL